MTRPGPKGDEALTPAEIGTLGEDLGARYLRLERGFRVLRRNFRAPKGGEVDLVCRDGDTLAFVEVKTRRGDAFARPAAAVDREKEALIIRGASHWLRLLERPRVLFRFDILEIVLEEGEVPRFTLIRQAFHLPDSMRY